MFFSTVSCGSNVMVCPKYFVFPPPCRISAKVWWISTIPQETPMRENSKLRVSKPSRTLLVPICSSDSRPHKARMGARVCSMDHIEHNCIGTCLRRRSTLNCALFGSSTNRSRLHVLSSKHHQSAATSGIPGEVKRALRKRIISLVVAVKLDWSVARVSWSTDDSLTLQIRVADMSTVNFAQAPPVP